MEVNEIRNNGFIDLDNYYRQLLQNETNSFQVLASQGLISVEPEGARIKFWLNYNGQKALYKKQYDASYESYAELIGEELAKEFELPCAHYDLASFTFDSNEKENVGVLSYNFLADDEEMITAAEIIMEVYNNHIKNSQELIELYEIEGLDEFQILNKLNNLLDMWSILEIYFKKNANKTKIVCGLMDDLVKLFLFDIITTQGDRHSSNWGIIIKENTVRIAPLFDNSNIFNLNRSSVLHDFNLRKSAVDKDSRPQKKESILKEMLNQLYHHKILFSVDGSDRINKKKNLEVITKFIEISETPYIELAERKIDFLLNGGIEEIFERIERRIAAPIPKEVKSGVITSIKLHTNNLKTIFSKKNETKNNERSNI